MRLPDDVLNAVRGHRYPLLFATVSGAHLYGFPSQDSDWDVRGSHVLPLEGVLGLDPPEETVEVSRRSAACDLDLVTHDVAKFVRLMLRNNGYVLEQLWSPLVVAGGSLHEELKDLGRGCVTRHHVHHYLGFAENQWRLFEKETPPRVKPLLYVYRVLLTGIHLLRTGTVESNLPRLLAEHPVPGVEDLIAIKVGGEERATLGASDLDRHARQVRELTTRLAEAGAASSLPEAPSARPELSAFLVRVRLARK